MFSKLLQSLKTPFCVIFGHFWTFSFFPPSKKSKRWVFLRYLLPNQASLAGATIFDWSTLT